MEQQSKKAAFLSALKRFFTRNIALKVIALLFAMLLWGYVLTDQKPVRVKMIADVTTSFDGEAELMAQGLCVRGDRAKALTNVTVSVRSQITNYAYLNNKSVSALISLKNISEPRTYELPIIPNVSSSLGVAQQVIPSTVSVEIDSLVTQTVPVTTSFVGEVPDGYWADMDALSTTARLDISGPKTDISRITRAECIVDLTNCTSSIYSTYGIIFYDRDGNEVPSDIVVGTLPTSTVRLPVYPMRNVPVDAVGSLVGKDNLAANHELTDVVATPPTVRIVGERAVIDEIESIALEPIAVTGLNAAVTVEAEPIVPENVRLLDTEPVSVLIEVRETVAEQSFPSLPIAIIGLPRNAHATLDLEAVDLTISGRISIVSLIKRGDISINVDLTGLEAGTYTLQLQPFVRSDEITVELTTKLSQSTVNVTITAP